MDDELKFTFEIEYPYCEKESKRNALVFSFKNIYDYLNDEYFEDERGLNTLIEDMEKLLETIKIKEVE